jgi:hypothetical protein
MTPMLPEYLCPLFLFPQNFSSMASCGECVVLLTYCTAGSFCKCLMNSVYMCSVAALNTKILFVILLLLLLLLFTAFEFALGAVVLILVINKHLYKRNNTKTQ